MTRAFEMFRAAYNVKWEGVTAEDVPVEHREIYSTDTAALECCNRLEEYMSKPSISTIAGNFDSETISDVRKTLEANADLDRNATIKWRGQDLVIAFGWYLVEFVESELAKRNTGGL